MPDVARASERGAVLTTIKGRDRLDRKKKKDFPR